MCARAHPFSYPGNGWTDCAEIWFVVRHQLAWRFTKIGGTGARAHVRAPCPYLGNSWTDCNEAWRVVTVSVLENVMSWESIYTVWVPQSRFRVAAGGIRTHGSIASHRNGTIIYLKRIYILSFLDRHLI